MNLQVQETISKHMAKYSQELIDKLSTLKTAYLEDYRQSFIDVIRVQVKVLEARMETLRGLEEELQRLPD